MANGVADITEADLRAFEDWLSQTTGRAENAAATQQHKLAAEYARNGLKFIRTLRREQSLHGFFADFLIEPFEGRLKKVLQEDLSLAQI